jgi:anti-sigma28 factor (negative regulator of flagellin synthesis)
MAIYFCEECLREQQAWEEISRTLAVREERIRLLKELVEQGDYAVDPRKTANSILAQLLLDYGIICRGAG